MKNAPHPDSIKLAESIALAIEQLVAPQAAKVDVASITEKLAARIEAGIDLTGLKRDKAMIDWLDAHPLPTQIQGGPDDGKDGKAWAVAAHAGTLREVLGVLMGMDPKLAEGQRMSEGVELASAAMEWDEVMGALINAPEGFSAHRNSLALMMAEHRLRDACDAIKVMAGQNPRETATVAYVEERAQKRQDAIEKQMPSA